MRFFPSSNFLLFVVAFNFLLWASLVSQLVQNPPTMQETWVQSLSWEDTLEKGKATHSSILENSMECIGQGVTKSWTQLSDFYFILLSHLKPFNTSCVVGLILMNSFNFCLSEKLFVSPSLAGLGVLYCRVFPLWVL